MALLLLVPGGLSDPVQGETGIGTDLNGSCLSLPDGLLHRLHQVLSIVHQHLGSLPKNKLRYSDDGCQDPLSKGCYRKTKTLLIETPLTCSDSSSLMLVRPNMVALTVDRILSWVLMVGMRSHT